MLKYTYNIVGIQNAGAIVRAQSAFRTLATNLLYGVKQ